MSKQILACGLKESFKSYESLDAETVQKMAKEQMQLLKEAGFEAQPYFIDINNPSALDEFKDLLKSKKWDGVCLGFGIRGDSDLTDSFEDFVNAVLENTNPLPKMMFPVGPDNLFARVKRTFGVA